MLIVASERAELKPLAGRLAGLQPWRAGEFRWAVTGRLGTLPMALVAGGSGRANAVSAVRRVEERLVLRGLVTTGWCGALDPALRVGEIVVAEQVLTLDGDRFPARDCGTGVRRGDILTVERFIATAEEKRRLRRTGAVAVEMEAAGVAREARRLGLPFYCVRAVSDPAEKDILMDFNRARLPGGNFSAARAAWQAGASPPRWREMLELWRGARLAAEALGEFLGSCRFDC